jgi:hypothetical protein
MSQARRFDGVVEVFSVRRTWIGSVSDEHGSAAEPPSASGAAATLRLRACLHWAYHDRPPSREPALEWKFMKTSCVCACVCVRACVRASERAKARVWVHVRVCLHRDLW